MKLRYLALTTLLLLAGCAGKGTESHVVGFGQDRWGPHKAAVSRIDGWQIEGKLGYQADQQAGSGLLFWLQRQDYSDIRLSGPIGIGALHLLSKPGSTSLEVSGEGTFEAESPEELLQQQLGWQLPVSHLLWWVRGIPAPDSPVQAELNGAGQLAWLIQDGWQVDFQQYEQQGDYTLPARLKLYGPQVTLTLVIKQWDPRQLGQ